LDPVLSSLIVGCGCSCVETGVATDDDDVDSVLLSIVGVDFCFVGGLSPKPLPACSVINVCCRTTNDETY
jgi:hypothetical protein